MKRLVRESRVAAVLFAATILTGCHSEPVSTAETDTDPLPIAADSANVAEEETVAEIEAPALPLVNEAPTPAVTATIPQAVQETPAITEVPESFPAAAVAEVVAPASVVATDPALLELARLAEAGDVDAQFEMAQVNAQNFEESNKWFLQAAENGHAEAQAVMAMRYSNGEGVPRDDQKAAQWLALAEQNFAQTQSYGNNVIIARAAKPQFAPRKQMGFVGLKGVTRPSGTQAAQLGRQPEEPSWAVQPLPADDGWARNFKPAKMQPVHVTPPPQPIYYEPISAGGSYLGSGSSGSIDSAEFIYRQIEIRNLELIDATGQVPPQLPPTDYGIEYIIP